MKKKTNWKKSIHILFVICWKRYQDWADFSKPQSMVIFCTSLQASTSYKLLIPIKACYFGWQENFLVLHGWKRIAVHYKFSMQIFYSDIFDFGLWDWFITFEIMTYWIFFIFGSETLMLAYCIWFQLNSLKPLIGQIFFIKIRVLCSQWVLAI